MLKDDPGENKRRLAFSRQYTNQLWQTDTMFGPQVDRKQSKLIAFIDDASVARTLHTYTNTVKILCEAFRIEFESSAFQCERKLIQEAFSFSHTGRTKWI